MCIRDSTYNCLSLDGDTSTNAMVEIMASGLAGNAEITAPGPAMDTFKACLLYTSILVLVKAHMPRIIQVVKVKHHRQLLAGICRCQLGCLNT